MFVRILLGYLLSKIINLKMYIFMDKTKASSGKKLELSQSNLLFVKYRTHAKLFLAQDKTFVISKMIKQAEILML